MKAVALAPTLPRFKKKPDELPRHLFALACSFSIDEEIIARWSDDAGWGSFDGATWRRRRCGQGRRTVRGRRSRDALQVLPVELLVDPRLRTLMNEQRCRAVLKVKRAG